MFLIIISKKLYISEKSVTYVICFITSGTLFKYQLIWFEKCVLIWSVDVFYLCDLFIVTDAKTVITSIGEINHS